jgi:hypothetical protein
MAQSLVVSLNNAPNNVFDSLRFEAAAVALKALADKLEPSAAAKMAPNLVSILEKEQDKDAGRLPEL